MRILYAVCARGLGHATRSLPILRRLVGAHAVVVSSDGAVLARLRGVVDGRAHFTAAAPHPNNVLPQAVEELLA